MTTLKLTCKLWDALRYKRGRWQAKIDAAKLLDDFLARRDRKICQNMLNSFIELVEASRFYEQADKYELLSALKNATFVPAAPRPKGVRENVHEVQGNESPSQTRQ